MNFFFFYNFASFYVTMDEKLQKAKQILGFDFDLKEEQNEAICAFMEKRDVVCLLPTGFGKSVIFQLMPFVVDDDSAVSIIISPLNSIMKDQVKKLCDSGVPACFLDMTGKDGTTYKMRKTQHDLGKRCLSVHCLFLGYGNFRNIAQYPRYRTGFIKTLCISYMIYLFQSRALLGIQHIYGNATIHMTKCNVYDNYRKRRHPPPQMHCNSSMNLDNLHNMRRFEHDYLM